MVKITEGGGFPTEISGRVVDCSKEMGKFGKQFHLLVKVSGRDKLSHLWVSTPESDTEVTNGSKLSIWIQRLKNFGIEDETISGTFSKLIGRNLRFKQEKLEKFDKEVWLPLEKLD